MTAISRSMKATMTTTTTSYEFMKIDMDVVLRLGWLGGLDNDLPCCTAQVVESIADWINHQ
jgi:hypothetical protein